MKVIRGKGMEYIPASHEDPKNPGVWKKVLVGKDDLVKGRVMMINWALLPKGNRFEKHYHEDMEEVFVILNGKVEMKVENETEILEKGDAVLVPVRAVHQMINISDEDVEYIAIGVSTEQGGRTINV